MAKAKKSAKKSGKKSGRKKPRSAKQKANDRRLGKMARARAAKCAPKKGAKKGAAKSKPKTGRKRRSAKQKANDKRLGKMARARAKGTSKPKAARKGRKGSRKGRKSTVSSGGKGMTPAEAKRLSHVEKVQNSHTKTLRKHSSQFSSILGTEKKMKTVIAGVKSKTEKILGAPAVSAASVKAAIKSAVRRIGKKIPLKGQGEWEKVAKAAAKDTEAAMNAKYS